tara:strand:- start:130 stop:375 length:246 start_codon:yes stop_codon:yes gene_type:complete
VNRLINNSNASKNGFWAVENKINGIKTIFLKGFIVREDHQEILERITYNIAIDTLDGVKNERALKIQIAFRPNIRELRNDL